jgi:hypothetical protein
MFDLPDSTAVNRFISKEKFYKKTAMNNKLRQLFTDEIEKITWLNKISPETLNVTKDDHMSELQIFEIQLKDRAVSNAVLKHIDSSIPYPIIYVLRRPSSGDMKVITSLTAVKKQFGSKTKHNDFISTGWSRPSGKFILNGNKVSHIYIGYIFQITGIAKQPYSDPKTAIERWERNQEIQKQIKAINKKLASEPSIAKKQELARERHRLESHLD